jgi:hypothetical protein
MAQLEEEDLPVVDPDLAAVAQDDAYEPTQPLAPVTPQTAGAAPQVPPTPPKELSDRDYVTQYLAEKKKNSEALGDAQETSNKNRLFARLGGAANTLANSLSHRPMDNSAFDQMAKDADIPVKRLETQQKMDQGGDKLLINYFANKSKQQDRKDYGDRNLSIKQQNADTAVDRNDRLGDLAANNLDLRKQGLGLRAQGLELRKGAQAAQASAPFLKDKVMMTTSQQLSQLDKGLGRIDDIMSGKMPFTTTIKADLEKDMANVLSGGTSSSLGQLHRVEFAPYVAKWQAQIDKVKGYQGDINAPGYVKQVRDLMRSMKADIQKIQGGRATRIAGTIKNAYSGNPLAAKSIDENVQLAQPKLSPEDQKALDWAKANSDDPRAAKILQMHGGQ